MADLRTLPEALADAARAGEGYTFMAGGSECRRPYSDLQQTAFRVARSLREAGLRRGDLVALALGDPEPFLTTLFGASIAGVVPASLYPPASAAELPKYFEFTAGILRAAAARAVVTTRSLASGFENVRASCAELELVLPYETLDAPALEPDRLPSLDDVAFVQFTSGSTSAPKGVALSHRNLSANVDAINGPAGLAATAADRAVSWLPLYHDMGLVGMALGPLYAKRPGVLLTPHAFVKRPVEWLKAISRFRATVSFAPNFAYDLAVRRVKDRDLDGIDLSCWRVAGCGAEPIHSPTLAAFAERFAPVGFRETSFFPCYGLAEHVLAATLPPRDRKPRVEYIEPSIPLVGCGRALPGHALRIVGDEGRALPERAIGEITLAGPSVMLGYYRDAALTAKTIRDGWLHTGDLGYLADGELFVCGRLKDIVIINGRKYHPQDLEWAVTDVPGVRHGGAVAFGVTGHGRPDRLVMVVEPSGAATADALAIAIRRRISDVFGLYVDDIVAAPSGAIGRTTSGKVRRAATKGWYEKREV